jgi:hypothetical protein
MPQHSQWERQWVKGVGGLTEIGFSEDENYILVLSHNGRGVIDIASGQTIARDYEEAIIDNDWWNEEQKTVTGIGPLEGRQIEMVGLWGGQLATQKDDWSITITSNDRSDIVQAVCDSDSSAQVLDECITEIRAAGFSPGGNYLVVATSSDLALFSLNRC